MVEKIYTIQQIQAILNPIFTNYNVRKAVLFGSYAKGLAKIIGKDVEMIDVSQVIPNSDMDNEIKRTGVMIYGE